MGRRAGKISTARQIEKAVNKINKIGESKRAAKQMNAGKSNYLHSYKAVKETLSTANNFANYAKENYGIKSIFELSQMHYKSYLDHLEQKGVSKGHLLNVETYLQKFETGMAQISADMGRESVKFTTERVYHSSDREKPENRAYNRSEIQQLEKHMSTNVREAMNISVNTGLRSREIENLRAEHIVERSGNLYIIFDKNNSAGVTKGGRAREIKVNQAYAEKLRSLAENKARHERLIPIKSSTMRDSLSKACRATNLENRGFHGFRHTFARERLQELLPGKNHLLNQIRENITEGYRVDRDMKREEFIQIRKAIDQIHNELGHGAGRWDLFEVYMK